MNLIVECYNETAEGMHSPPVCAECFRNNSTTENLARWRVKAPDLFAFDTSICSPHVVKVIKDVHFLLDEACIIPF